MTQGPPFDRDGLGMEACQLMRSFCTMQPRCPSRFFRVRRGAFFRPPITWDGMVFAPTSDGITMGWDGIVHCDDGVRVRELMGWDGNWWDGKCDGMGELVVAGRF